MNKRVKALFVLTHDRTTRLFYLCVFPTHKAPLYHDSTFGDEDTEHPEDKLPLRAHENARKVSPQHR